MSQQTLLQQILDDGQRTWFGDPIIFGAITMDGLPMLCDHTGRIIPWDEIEECYHALRSLYEQYPPEAIAAYNEKLSEEIPETSWEAWRRQRRVYRPGVIYLLQDPLGMLQPRKGAYKIGRTTQLNLRMQAYGAQKRQLRLVHTLHVSDVVWAEQFLIRRLEHRLIYGREWFALSAEEIAWIEKLPSF